MERQFLLHTSTQFKRPAAILENHLPDSFLSHWLCRTSFSYIHTARFQTFFTEIVRSIRSGCHINFDNLLLFYFNCVDSNKRHYVGVRKDGSVLGIGDPDGVMLQIVNSLKDSLAPDIMPFVREQLSLLSHTDPIATAKICIQAIFTDQFESSHL